MNDHRQTVTSRDRLLQAAASLFQERGYHGTSIADVLGVAALPKGSLYHHFPNGKADLAASVASLVSDVMMDIVRAAYDGAETTDEGAARLFEKCARLFERHVQWRTCPIQSFLIDNALPGGRAESARILQAWIDETAARIGVLGGDESEAEDLWVSLIGAWTLAGARNDPAPLRVVGQRYGAGRSA